jgi:hypothetical protein
MSEKIKTYEPSGNDVIRRFREYNDLLWQINVETLTADKTLTSTDKAVQILNPNGNNRIITLPDPTNMDEGAGFTIKNNNDSITDNYYLEINDWATVEFKLSTQEKVTIISDGSNWYITSNMFTNDDGRRPLIYGYNNTPPRTPYGIMLGYANTIDSFRTCIGYNNTGDGGSVIVIGSHNNTEGNGCILMGQTGQINDANYSVLIAPQGGSVAVDCGYSVGIGTAADITKARAVAIGSGVRGDQPYTMSVPSGSTYSRSYIPSWFAVETDVVDEEIFLGGTPSERLELPDQTFVMTWDLQVSAIDYDTDLYHAGFHLIGTARFDGGTNNQILNSNWSTTDHVLYRPSTDIDIEPFVDNTYEALRLRVTAYNSSPEIVYAMRWHVTGQVSVVLA